MTSEHDIGEAELHDRITLGLDLDDWDDHHRAIEIIENLHSQGLEIVSHTVAALGRAVAESTAKLAVGYGVVVVTGPPDRRIHSTTAGSLYSAIHEAAGLTGSITVEHGSITVTP